MYALPRNAWTVSPMAMFLPVVLSINRYDIGPFPCGFASSVSSGPQRACVPFAGRQPLCATTERSQRAERSEPEARTCAALDGGQAARDLSAPAELGPFLVLFSCPELSAADRLRADRRPGSERSGVRRRPGGPSRGRRGAWARVGPLSGRPLSGRFWGS
jgi:hypothetical protein